MSRFAPVGGWGRKRAKRFTQALPPTGAYPPVPGNARDLLPSHEGQLYGRQQRTQEHDDHHQDGTTCVSPERVPVVFPADERRKQQALPVV